MKSGLAASAYVLVVFGAQFTLQAGAQGTIAPSATVGSDLTYKLCSGCHAMDGVASGTVPAGLPSLRGIANREGQTGQRIFDTLINPHPPMPDTSLSIGEIESIILYLETLRSNPAVPPLLVPRDRRQIPKYPRPT